MKVIFTGDMCGGKELAMLCIILLILGLPLTGTVMVFVTGVTAFGTSFRRTGEELEEFVRRLLRGFSSSSEQLTPRREVLFLSYIFPICTSQRFLNHFKLAESYTDFQIREKEIADKFFLMVTTNLFPTTDGLCP